MLKIDLIQKLDDQITILQQERDAIKAKQATAIKSGCFSRFFVSVKSLLHDEIAIKNDKIRALTDIRHKLNMDHFKSSSDYHRYLDKYRGDPRVQTSRVFNGLFNRTEKLLYEVGDFLAEQTKVAKVNNHQAGYKL